MAPQHSRELAPTPARPQSVGSVAHALAPRPSALSSTPDVLTLLKALRRRWTLGLGLGLLLAGIVGPAAWFLVPRAKYTASSTLYVSLNPKRIIFEPKDSRPDPSTYQRTQVALLTDRYVLAHALSKPEVSGRPLIKEKLQQHLDPEEWLKESLQAKFPGGSEILEVSLTGDHPEDMATVVNSVIDSYMTLIVEEENKERLNRLEKLRELWEKYQSDLKVKRKQLGEVAAAVGTHDQAAVAMAQQFKVAQISLAQGELMRSQSETLKMQAGLKALESGQDEGSEAVAPAVPEATIEKHVAQHPDVVQSKGELDELARRYWQVNRTIRLKSDPALMELRRRWQVAKERLNKLCDRVRAEVRQGLNAGSPGGGPADRAVVTARLRAQVEVQKGYQDALAKDIDRLQKEVGNLNRGGLDLENEREEISIATEFARKVGSEIEYVQVELNAPARVRVLAKAKVPNAKDELRKVKAGAVAAMGSIVIALLGVSFWEFRTRRVDTPDEVVSGLGMKLVGALPALPGRSLLGIGGKGGETALRWKSLMVESIDATRTMLLHASRVESVRTVMVTSAVKGEGKTSLACHLATSLARAGRRTLLIDCDLRSPSIHRLFDMPLGPGLCEILRGEVAIAGAVRADLAAGLDFIAAGDRDALALQVLAQDGLQNLLGELKGRYDFIIVDSAPVLAVADSLLIGQNVDGVLFSVLRDVSRLPMVYAAHERLMGLGVKLLGAVVSGVSGEAYVSEYYNAS